MSFDGKTASLQITNFNSTKAGNYECVAKSEFGEVKSSTRVTFEKSGRLLFDMASMCKEPINLEVESSQESQKQDDEERRKEEIRRRAAERKKAEEEKKRLEDEKKAEQARAEEQRKKLREEQAQKRKATFAEDASDQPVVLQVFGG